MLVEELPGLDGKALQEAATALLAQLGDPAAVLLASRGEGEAAGKVSFAAALSPQVSSSFMPLTCVCALPLVGNSAPRTSGANVQAAACLLADHHAAVLRSAYVALLLLFGNLP